jgi:hypothetical protein
MVCGWRLGDTARPEPESTAAAAKIEWVRQHAKPELQKYASEPPGKGFGVVYIGINLVNGKSYVGQHAHGISGKCVKKARWYPHLGAKTYTKLSFAVKKYGKGAFEWFILCRVVDEAPLNDKEVENIAQFDAVCNGYNIQHGGGGKKKSVRGLDALRLAARDPVKRAKHRDDMLSKWKDPVFRENNLKLRNEVLQRPDVKKKKSLSSKAAWLIPGYRERHVAKQKIAQNRESTKKLVAEASKTNWQNPEYANKMKAIRKSTWATPGFKQKMKSAMSDSKERRQAEDPDLAAREAARLLKMRNSDAVRAKRRATILEKRKAVLAACKTESERKKKIRQWKKTDNLQLRTFAASGQTAV